ncbi:MAG: TonB-dependent receptor [Kiloniellales bacterium]|nr:TonB-dependent receptor [Kiloniellales bacterium]
MRVSRHWTGRLGKLALVIPFCLPALAGASEPSSVTARNDPQGWSPNGLRFDRVLELAQADAVQIDIPAQPLSDALRALGRQTGLQFFASSELTQNLTAPAVAGRMSADEALSRLLAGSGLTYRYRDTSVVALERNRTVAESGPIRLDPVTVTARRTEELVQDVPGSVFVLGSEEIEKSNVEDLEDVALLTPNFNITETGDRQNIKISIRGISTLVNTSLASAPVVGVYLDEVLLNPTGSSNGIDPNLFDLERAEVLYGPQGTAFGRGTIGGAVNYVSKKPTEGFEAELEGELGSHPDGMVHGIVNGSLTSDRTLMARLVAVGRYDDGFIDTPIIGGSNDEQDYGGRLSLRSQPTDRLTLDLAGSFDRSENSGPSWATVDSLEGDGDLELRVNEEYDQRIDRGLVTFRGAYDFNAGTLIANTFYLDVETSNRADLDASEIDAGFFTVDTSDDSIGQEVRFESDTFPVPLLGDASFLLGVNGTWAESKTGYEFFTGGTALAINTLGFGTEVFDAGAFGELRFRPIKKLELTAGGRFTYNEVEASQAGFEDVGQSFTNFSPKGSILYDWTDDLATYALISTGFKSGGFNTLGTGPLSGRAFDNETAINYEAGIKSSWFDKRLFVNASGFALFYDNLQVNEVVVLNPTTNALAIDNAASARSLGGELEVAALPMDGLQLNLSYGYADARFTDYEDAPNGDLSNETLPNAPRHTLSFIADYSHPVFDDFADAFIRTEYSYTSGVQDITSPFRTKFDPYDVLNLRLGLRADRFDIEAFVENVFDEKYATGEIGATALRASRGVSDVVEVGTTRRFGIRGRLRF